MATIKSKIIINIVIVLLTIITIVGLEYYNLQTIRTLDEENGKRAEDALLAAKVSQVGDSLSSVIASAVINRDLEASAQEWQEAKERCLKLLDDVTKSAQTQEEKEWTSAAGRAAGEIITLYEQKELPLLKNDNGVTQDIRDLDSQMDKHVDLIAANMRKLEEFNRKEIEAANAEFDSYVSKSITEALAVGFIGIALMAGLAGWLLRSIMRPINAMIAMLQDMSEGQGDLTKRLDDSSKDEIAVASRYFNLFIEKLRGIIAGLAQATIEIASASTQLHETAEQMATGAEEVAAQAGTVATAGEEMSATSGTIAQNCLYAAEGSQHASAAAVSGAKVVDETIAVMNSIAERVKNSARAVESLGSRSDQIGEIIGTIEDIADQTNLLALNAAIEAARAGEQGRGFAVVADEVRALAERTTKATKEIGEMIKAIQTETGEAVTVMEEGVSEVSRGSEKATESGKALGQILEQINAVTSQIAQVATAAEEQTATTSEISRNMQQITEVVAQTASGSQESAAAANQLSALAEELKKVVGQFKVD